jgi:hypothetical protein
MSEAMTQPTPAGRMGNDSAGVLARLSGAAVLFEAVALILALLATQVFV